MSVVEVESTSISAPAAAEGVVDAPLPPRLMLSALAVPGLRALRRNWPAIVGLQTAGLAIVVAYYTADGFRHGCDTLAEWKAAGGLAAAAVLFALVCGLLPEAAKIVFGIDRSFTRARARHVLFNVSIYVFLGIAADTFYRLLARYIGPEVTVRNVLAKVMLDQFVYTPLLGVMFISLAYTWREYRYSFRRLLAVLGPHWYVTRVVILLLPSWSYWIPMSALMYSLPPGLTFLFGAAGSAAAALLLTSVAGEASTPSGDRKGSSINASRARND